MAQMVARMSRWARALLRYSNARHHCSPVTRPMYERKLRRLAMLLIAGVA